MTFKSKISILVVLFVSLSCGKKHLQSLQLVGNEYTISELLPHISKDSNSQSLAFVGLALVDFKKISFSADSITYFSKSGKSLSESVQYNDDEIKSTSFEMKVASDEKNGIISLVSFTNDTLKLKRLN
jgi:hypothetical protein